MHVKQGWGEAQISGVLHHVNVERTTATTDIDRLRRLVRARRSPATRQESKIGLGRRRGRDSSTCRQFGAGDTFLVTGSYTQNAVWYSGLPDGMWGENGQVNGNGQAMFMSDAFFNPLTNQWSTPTAWSVSALLEHHFTPQFYVDLEGSVGGLNWSNQSGGCYVLGFGCGIAAGGTGRTLAARDQLDHRRRPRLEPGHQPELRPRVDVSGTQPAERPSRLPRDGVQLDGVAAPTSLRAPGKATRAASPAVSASPVTSDRNPIG